jgi:hypothetical protein
MLLVVDAAERHVVREPRSHYGEQNEWGNSIDRLRANLRPSPLARRQNAEVNARRLLELRESISQAN